MPCLHLVDLCPVSLSPVCPILHYHCLVRFQAHSSCTPPLTSTSCHPGAAPQKTSVPVSVLSGFEVSAHGERQLLSSCQLQDQVSEPSHLPPTADTGKTPEGSRGIHREFSWNTKFWFAAKSCNCIEKHGWKTDHLTGEGLGFLVFLILCQGDFFCLCGVFFFFFQAVIPYSIENNKLYFKNLELHQTEVDVQHNRCPATGQGAMGTNWSTGSSVWAWGRTSSLWGWRSPGTRCPGRLWSLLLWRYSRPAWTRSCAACFGRGVGLDDPQRSLPTPTIQWFCDSMSSHSSWMLYLDCKIQGKQTYLLEKVP